MKQLIISIILLIFLFFLIIYSLLSKLHLMHFTAALICFYNYSYSSYFHDHGAFNLISFIMELWANKEKNSKIKEKHFVRITKYLKENGYINGYASDSCKKDGTGIYHNLTKEELYDHQLLLCDPNSAVLNSIRIRCFYGIINSYYLYDYINQFWRKYENNRKFSMISIDDSHKATL